ncbi:tetratricopeptide repeat protein [Nocardia sp. NBC_01730]|uniref:tetratricopeptide repeat protein n=1 Tax=Nocardia sp. NBC_01730 TaxID=2975998 RepID=UPI002E0FFD4C|nr:tetratricopeptide repeat protein [Nocardia sp. NBC_01730]
MIRLAIDTALVTGDIGCEQIRQMPTAADQRLTDLLWRSDRQPSAELLRELGVALGHRFLDGPVGDALAEELQQPGRHRLGIEVTDPAVADLPWETLVPPGRTMPLALDPAVDLYRTVRIGACSAAGVEGPLRILAAIGSPDASSLELLDYERELGRILDAVDPGHRSGVRVRILEWGSTAAIRAALAEEEFHILHVSCHAGPGALLLETGTGAEDRVDAARFLAEAFPPGRTVPLISLTGCSTARDGKSELPGLARSLLGHGAPAVLAMNGVVSDNYVIDLCAKLYERLAGQQESALLTVFSEVRRELERAPRPLPEWARPVLFLADPELRLTGRGNAAEHAVQPPEPAVIRDGAAHKPGDFIGRRSALRRLSRAEPRIVLHGIGGVGKTSLAAELAQRFRIAGGVVVAISGATTVDAILEQLRRELRFYCGKQEVAESDPLRQLVIVLAERSRDQRDRLAAIARSTVLIMLVLDDFEDNLDVEHQLSDPELAAFLLAWPERHRLVITSRHPFPLPGLDTYPLGPLSWQETRKLIWRLPGLDRLTPREQWQVWTQLGGHPRSLEYLDALLRDGVARFDEVTDRLRVALAGRGVRDGDLGEKLAETGALIAEDVLLPQLIAHLDTVPLARRLLLGASVYRLPVDRTGLAWQVASVSGDEQPPPAPDGLDDAIDKLLQLGLLAPSELGYLVHRWTAGTIARLAGREQLADRHRQAADYRGWRMGATSEQLDYIQQAIEARYHQLAAGSVEEAIRYTELACRELDVAGHWSWEERLRREVLAVAPPGSQQSAQLTADLGGLYMRRGEYEQAVAKYQEALTIFRRLGADGDIACALQQLGLIAESKGNRREAEGLFRESMSIKERIGDRWAMAITIHNLAGIAMDNGDDQLAEEQYLDALDISQELGDLEGIAASHHQIGILAFRAKDYVRAERCIQVALSNYNRLRDRINIGNGLVILARISLALFYYETAQVNLRAALEVFEDIGSNRHIAECYLQLGEIARDVGELDWAEICFARAQAIFSAVGEQVFLAMCSRGLGAVRTVLGRVADAVPCTVAAWFYESDHHVNQRNIEWLAIQRMELGAHAFSDVLLEFCDPARAAYVLEQTESFIELYNSYPSPTHLGSGYIKLGIASHGQRDYGTARMCFVRALPICEAAGYSEGVAKCHEDLGLVGLETRRLEEAETSYLAALEVYQRLDHDTNMAIVHHQLGRVCEDRKDYVEAERHFRASIAIKRRLGNLSGVSNSTFHLGRVTQSRGDLALAERYFRDCLAIDEGQEDWHGIAMDYAGLGSIRAEQGLAAEAISLTVEALSINQRIKSDNAIRNITVLREERAKLGDDEFTRILRHNLDQLWVSRVLELTTVLPSTRQDARIDRS